jgi:uracil phosphoribosyltransferase
LLLLLQVVPILRAGLVLLEQAATLLPASETYHLGYVRDDETLQVGSDELQHSMTATVL